MRAVLVFLAFALVVGCWAQPEGADPPKRPFENPSSKLKELMKNDFHTHGKGVVTYSTSYSSASHFLYILHFFSSSWVV